MSIRTYLILSYLVLIFLLTLGFLLGGLQIVGKSTRSNLSIAENSIQEVTKANYQLSEQILTQMGKQIIDGKAEEVAKELAYLLKRKKYRNYQELRQDEQIRKVATQKIYTMEGDAGYTLVFDKKAENIFHPDRKVEGQNYAKWEKKYPEMWKIVKSALSQKKTEGYLTFFDIEFLERVSGEVLLYIRDLSKK